MDVSAVDHWRSTLTCTGATPQILTSAMCATGEHAQRPRTGGLHSSNDCYVNRRPTMSNHPEIPKHERFRINKDTGQAEFRLGYKHGLDTWQDIDSLTGDDRKDCAFVAALAWMDAYENAWFNRKLDYTLWKNSESWDEWGRKGKES